MKVVLTGRPGIGKTTVVKKVVSRFKGDICGFFTEEIRDESGRRKGFVVVDVDGNRALLASKEGNSPYRVGSYSVFVEEFEKIALPQLERAIREKIPAIIDEIGKMELFSDRFELYVREIFSDDDISTLATVPLKNIHPVVSWIKRLPQVLLIEVNYTNRDLLPDEIIKILERSV
ncbi:NTPase [Persephonella sp.]